MKHLLASVVTLECIALLSGCGSKVPVGFIEESGGTHGSVGGISGAGGPASGGASPFGGASATGGVSATGGRAPVGGNSVIAGAGSGTWLSGGATSTTGGTRNTGGTPNTGGTSSQGGLSGLGGTPTSLTGGTGTTIAGNTGTGGATGGTTSTGGTAGTGGISTIAMSPCDRIAGAYQVPASSAPYSRSLLFHIGPDTNGNCMLIPNYAWEPEGKSFSVTWKAQTVEWQVTADAQCCTYYNSWNLAKVTLDLDTYGRLLGTGQVNYTQWIGRSVVMAQSAPISLGPMLGATSVWNWKEYGSLLFPWDKATMRSARLDTDLAQELVPLNIGSGQWTQADSSSATTDLGTDWDATRGTSIPVDVQQGATDDDGLPLTSGTFNVTDVGATSTSIAFSQVPPGSIRAIVASPRPAVCGTSACLELPDYANAPDRAPSAIVGWQMDTRGKTQLSITCGGYCSTAFHPIPEGSSIQTLAPTTDAATGAITNHYSYSNISRLGIVIRGNGIYLISAEVY